MKLWARWARRIRSWMTHAIVFTLLPGVVFAGVPLPVAAAESNKDTKRPSAPPPTVKVNRKVPAVTPPALAPEFSADPQDVEFLRVRVLDEPIVPIGGKKTAGDNRALAAALMAYTKRADPDDVSALTGFLEAHPESRWRASLLVNLGVIQRWAGRFSRAMILWQQAWDLAKSDETPGGRAVADRAVGELAAMHSRLGHFDDLERIFADVTDRDVRGPGGERLQAARAGLWMMQNEPGRAFRCGPFALDRIRVSRGETAAEPKIVNSRSTKKGTSLAQVSVLAAELKMGLQPARRSLGAEVLLPAVVHWKVGHFASLIKKEGERYLVQDPTFVEDFWVSPAALEEEASGYFLVREGELPAGWTTVEATEAATIWGKGHVGYVDENGTNPNDPSTGCPPPPAGMPGYRIHVPLVSLNIIDTPVRHSPPRGPDVTFTVRYSQKEAKQPAIFTYSNFGARWTFDWLSYVRDHPTNPAHNLELYNRGGGTLVFSSIGTSGATAPELKTQTRLRRALATDFDPTFPPGAPAYVQEMGNGSQYVYYQSDGAVTYPRKIFLKKMVDPQGHTVELTYDALFRIVAITDAIGQVTTISYELPADPYKITRVTDPFGRTARFEYTGEAPPRLKRITDVIGMSSEFTYGTGDFITSLTTPYGTTRFTMESRGNTQWIEAEDPLGGRERVEYQIHKPSELPAEAAETVPSGGCAGCTGETAEGANTFYWDKRAMALAPGDYSKAHNVRWLISNTSANPVAVKASEKLPLENRVYYFYDGQPDVFHVGTSSRPRRTARVLGLDEAGRKIEQSYWYEFNDRGQVTRATDPAGRETIYEYADNGVDLLTVKQRNGNGHDVLSRRTYNTQHKRLTETDAAGQTTTFTYNAHGQLETVTSPPRAGIVEERTTAYAYDPDGYLRTITAPAAGATSTFTYDAYGRVRTKTDADGYTVTYDHDALDRPTKATYPDGTYEESVYGRLDLEQRRDRLGRWTRVFFDALRRVVAVRDPLGRQLTFKWCTCGSLDSQTDPNGNITSWEYDVRGRVTKERQPGAAEWLYEYETAISRLRAVTDPKGQRKTYTYFIDDKLKQVGYEDAEIPTPPVAFAYDSYYDRIASMTDATGTTLYSYRPIENPPALGAGQLASVDGPFTNDLVTYSYDEHHRVVRRTIAGAALTFTYDSLGRVTHEANALGTFEFAPDGASPRVSTVTYPNGLITTHTYFPNAGDRRLRETRHVRADGAPLSRHEYAYDATGNVVGWNHQVGLGPERLATFTYDEGDQLSRARMTGPEPGAPSRFAYAYDAAGNRVAEQLDDVVTAADHDGRNRLVARGPGGSLVIGGTLNEAGAVAVQGQPAAVAADNSFAGRALVGSGTSTVAVTATDAAGNARTNTYSVEQAGPSTSYTYDENGNLLGDGTRTLEWDAANRLVAVNRGAARSEFTYDGKGRRIRIVEKVGGALVSDDWFLWCDDQICERRDGSGDVKARYFALGLQEDGADYFYLKDHLGSVRELVDSSGNVRARYDYDPYGRVTKVAGDKESPFRFTGHYFHAPTALSLTMYRAYDSTLARWLSPDPAGTIDGVNLYAYVNNNPVLRTDPLGLCGEPCWDKMEVTAVGLDCKMDYVSATGMKGLCAKKAPDEAKKICDDVKEKIKKKGKADLDPAVCPEGETCSDKKAIETFEPIDEKVTFAVPVEKFGIPIGTCHVTLRVTGKFVGKGEKGTCLPPGKTKCGE